MTYDESVLLLILTSLVALLVFSKWRYDVIAMAALLAAVIFGVVPLNTAFYGFGHPATITVAMILIISSALTKAGAIDDLASLILPCSHNQFLHVAILAILAAVTSMFMNNVGALAILMPVAIETSYKVGRHPSAVLMPLSFGSILGGTTTLIGTPPNIIISSYRLQATGQPFSMFDFAPVGGSITILGVAFVTLLGWGLFRTKAGKEINNTIFQIEAYTCEIKILESSKLVGTIYGELEKSMQDLDLMLVSLIHKTQKFYIPPKNHVLSDQDILILEGGHEDLDKFITRYEVGLVNDTNDHYTLLGSSEADTIEFIVMPNSRLEGRKIEQIKFRTIYNLNILGVYRQGQPFRGRLKAFQVSIGDVLLVHGENKTLFSIMNNLGCLPLRQQSLISGRRKYSLFSLIIFLVGIAISITGLLPIHISLGLSLLVLVLTNILPAKELYDSIEWPVIILLGSMIPLGDAMETTGATHSIVQIIMYYAQNIEVWQLLSIILIITMMLSDILNNAATAILMAPIASSIGLSMGYSADPFLMAVAIGSSCAFLTPIGHQNNALIMGPGGYNFKDYWKLGLPLEILIITIAIPALLHFWPPL